MASLGYKLADGTHIDSNPDTLRLLNIVTFGVSDAFTYRLQW